jgi:hypothetical protein
MNGSTPCSDAKSSPNGGDGKLDIYLLGPSRDNVPDRIAGDLKYLAGERGGVTVAEDQVPHCNGRSYGFSAVILLDTTQFGLPLHVTLSHELFHAFQFGFPVAGADWVNEATATWFEDQVFPDYNIQAEWKTLIGSENCWSTAQMKTGVWNTCTLDTWVDHGDQQYSTYLYFFYLTNAGGYDPSIVGDIYAALTTGANPLQTVASLTDFQDSFKKFVLRNWNEDPVESYVDAGAKIDNLDQRAEPVPVTPGQEGNFDVKLKPAQASYHQIVVEDDPNASDPDHRTVKQLTVDLSQLSADQNLDVQAIITIGTKGSPGYNQYVENWTGSSEKHYCRDRSNENVSNIVLVLSNHAVQGNVAAHKVKAKPDLACAPAPGNLVYTASSGGKVTSGFMSGAFYKRLNISSRWKLEFVSRDSNDPTMVTYKINAENIWNYSGSSHAQGKAVGPIGNYQVFSEFSESSGGNGVAHNPPAQGDDQYVSDQADGSLDAGIHDAGTLTVWTTADGKDHYRIDLNISGVFADTHYTTHQENTCVGTTGNETTDTSIDNLSKRRHSSHHGCGVNQDTNSYDTMPRILAFPMTGDDQTKIFTGTFTRSKGRIAANITDASQDCVTSSAYTGEVLYNGDPGHITGGSTPTGCSGDYTATLTIDLPAAGN